ncbi:MAG: hypothetical protein K1X55_13575 [Chitinophagales bacterium]|nr:hypothetical protein [Chitinophagales bacterium]
MEKDTTNDIGYFLLTNTSHKDDLAAIRSWKNLRVAFVSDEVWVRDFTPTQIKSVEVKSIPYKTLYQSKNSKLHLLDSLLPERNIPSFLWTPIERALPIALPSFNHNFFGIQEKVPIKLVPTETEADAVAMIASLSDMKAYLETAPAIRLQKLSWAVLNRNDAIILGKPLLPIVGETFWNRNGHLLPTGYDFQLPILSRYIQYKINPDSMYWVMWNKNDTHFLLPKKDIEPLTLSSFRMTYLKIGKIRS